MAGLPINLDDLIHGRSVEQNRLEFKGTWDVYIKQAVIRTICALANDLLNLNGGYIVIGIEADRQGRAVLPPRGLSEFNLDEIQREIRGQCNRIDPLYFPMLFPAVFQDKPILIVWAPGGDNRPYRAPKTLESGERVHFIRAGSETVEARGDIQRQLLERATRVPFDDRRSAEASIESISPTLVRRFLADIRSDLSTSGTAVDDRELYRRLRIVTRANDHELPRNVALLFFHEDPDRFFPGARIEIAQFADDAGGDLIEERAIRGPIPDQIRFTLDYLNSLADVLVKKVPGRAEVERTVAYPYEAMEEALVNAVYHRSYDITREPVKIYFYPDRMEIISYPGPLPGVEQEHFLRGRHVPPVPARNRRVGEFLKELHLAEARGTGIPKIHRKMEENGSPEPRFDFDPTRTYFRVILPAHPRYQVLHALRESAHLWAIGDRSSALAHLQRAYETQPASGAIAGQTIHYAMESGNFDLAKTTFDRFVSEERKSEVAQPYLRYANSLLDRRQAPEARRVLAMIPPSGSTDDIAEAAILRRRVKDFKEAHRLFEQIFAEKRDDPRIVHEFASTKIQLARGLKQPRDRATRKRLMNEAVELLHRVLQLIDSPVREAWAWFDLAQVSTELREPVATIEAAYLKAISIRPEEPRFQDAYKRWKGVG